MKTMTAIFFGVILMNIGCSSIPAPVVEHRKTLESFEVDGTRIAYVDQGPRDGEAIVLLHGLPSSSYLYRNIIGPLAKRGFRVIAPDFLGYGASDKPEEPTAYAFEAHARRTFALMDHLKVSKANFVVHDLGGLVAWEMLGLAPKRIERLLILNTTAYSDGFVPPSKMKMLGGFLGAPMSSMMEGGLFGPSLVRQFLSEFTVHSEKLLDDDISQYWWPIHEGTTASMRLMAGNFDAIIRKFPRYQENLKSYRGPVMILWGKQDKVLNFEMITAQFSRDLRIPSERIAFVEDAGHYIQEDHPEIVTVHILKLVSILVRS